jgi:hypothetical protein
LILLYALLDLDPASSQSFCGELIASLGHVTAWVGANNEKTIAAKLAVYPFRDGVTLFQIVK